MYLYNFISFITNCKRWTRCWNRYSTGSEIGDN